MIHEDRIPFYSEWVTPGISQCDLHGFIKPGSLLEIIQNSSNAHCRAIRVGRKELLEKGLAWVLFKTDVQVLRYPVLGEKILVETFTKGNQLHFFPRYFLIKDSSGTIIAQGGSLWMLMDLETRKTVSPKAHGISVPDYQNTKVPITVSFAKRNITGRRQEFIIRPQFTDIDINGHVNNIRYVDWLCNNLGMDLLAEYEVSYLSIDYLSEIHPEDNALCILELSEKNFQYSGHRDTKVLFNIYGELRNRSGFKKGV